MGIIQRQSIKNTIVSYVGVGIGIISALFIYPLAPEEYGLFRVMFDSAILCMPFILLGSNALSIRFFPWFKASGRSRAAFFTFLLAILLSGSVLYLLWFPAVRPWFVRFYSKNSPLIGEYMNAIFLLALILSFVRLVTTYTTNFQRIVVPSILNDLLQKLSLPALILLVVYGFITVDDYVQLILLVFLLISLLLSGYLATLGEFRLARFRNILKKPFTGEAFRFGTYNILAILGGQVAFRIDTLMVGGLASLKEAGIYTIVAVLSEVISKPSNAIRSIAGPIISDRLAAGDLDHVRMLYKKSAVNLFIAGLGIFLVIWLSISDIIAIMPNSTEMMAGIYVVFFLGMAKVIDMVTSLNGEILSYSRYYAYNLVFIFILAILNVITNLLLIPEYGLVGAAIATFISLSLFNVIKLIFIQVKLGMHPFSTGMIWTALAGAGAFFLIQIIPMGFPPVVNLFIRSAAFGFLFILPVVWLNVSPDLNSLLRSKLGNWIP